MVVRVPKWANGVAIFFKHADLGLREGGCDRHQLEPVTMISGLGGDQLLALDGVQRVRKCTWGIYTMRLHE